MNSITNLSQLSKLVKSIRSRGKTIVLVGGCFDILHLGHVVFLEKAKTLGEVLIVLLESDERIKKIKGQGRPFYTQKERAKVLSAVKYVDFIVLLPTLKADEEYDGLVTRIKPDFIAATRGDQEIGHKQRVAKLVRAKIKFVTGKIGNYSTSRILQK